MSIWDIFSKAISFFNTQWIWKKCCDEEFESAWAGFPYCFSKHPLKRDFLDISLSTSFESVTSKIKSLRGSSFLLKCVKMNLDFKNAAKNWERFFCFWDNCMWIGIVNLSLWRTTYFSSKPMCEQAGPRYCMSIKETFSNSIDLAVLNESDQGSVMQLPTVLGHVYHVACRRVLWNGTF